MKNRPDSVIKKLFLFYFFINIIILIFRYIEIFETTKKIFRLLDENIRLFCNLPLRSDISQEREDNENHHCDFDQGKKSTYVFFLGQHIH